MGRFLSLATGPAAMIHFARFVLVGALLGMPAVAPAQGFLEQLMKDLIESQRQRQLEDQAPPVVIGGQRAPAAGASRTGEVRGRLQAFSAECDNLSKILRQEVRRNRAVAPYLIEMVRVSSRADLLQRKYAKPQPDQVILADLQELDAEWRNVAFRLGQVPGLSDACSQSLTRMNDLCAACCSLYEVAPQLDRREVARLADSLAAELHHLERDIEYEVRQRRKAQQMILRVQRVEGLAKLVGEAAHQGDPLEVVVDAFQRYRQEWRQIAGQLVSLEDRHIERSLAEIRELNRGLRGHLRVEAGIDRDRLVTLSNKTRERISAAYASISLADLLSRPDAAEVLAAAQRLDREAAGLCECVTASSPRDEIAEHWRSLHSSWTAYDTLCEPLRQPRSSRFRQDVASSLGELRGLIGVSNVFDRRAVTRCAADLASVAGEAQHRVAMWSGRPGARVDAALIRQAQSLINDCRSLHERCAGRTPQAELARDCEQLAKKWSRLRPQLLTCNTVDQRVLRRLSDDATAHLIELQGLLGSPVAI